MTSYRAARLSLALTCLGLAALGCAAAELTQATRLDIDTQLRGRQQAFADCYSAGLKKNRELRGSMTLVFMVEGGTGMVAWVRAAQSDLPDEEVKQCVVQRAQGMRVSQISPAPIEVTYPLRFSPSDMPF